MKAKHPLVILSVLPFLLLISYLVLALGSALPDSLAYHSPLKEASIQRVPIETPEEDVAVRFVTLPSAQITPTMAYTSYLPIVIKPEPPPQPTDCDLYEPNDTSEQANTIQPGEMRTDCVLPETDIDWWVFLVTTEAEVIIEVLGDGGSGDLYVKLYDNNLNLIESDIGFGGTDAQIDRLCGTGQDPLSAGTYYVSVEDYLNNDEIIPYDISLVVAPCPSAVVLANHSSYITLDSSPSLIVVGEIQNNGVIGMRDIRLVVNLFNNSGQLIDTTVAYNFRWLDSALGPGDKTCFQAEFSEFDGWSYYEFETPTYTSIGDPLQNMTVYGDNGTYDPGDGSYRILGFIRNDNDSQVTDVDLIATLYDTVNTTVGCGFTPTNNDDLNPGQSSSFELTFSGSYRDYADVDSYRLQVDGFLQEP